MFYATYIHTYILAIIFKRQHVLDMFVHVFNSVHACVFMRDTQKESCPTVSDAILKLLVGQPQCLKALPNASAASAPILCCQPVNPRNQHN